MEFVRCYLCSKSVNILHWSQGFHQLDCQIRNRKALESLSEPTPDFRCFRCGDQLRAWTGDKDRVKFFKCALSKKPYAVCTTQGMITNTLESKCHFCFRCDLDFCCLEQETGRRIMGSFDQLSLKSKSNININISNIRISSQIDFVRYI